MRAGLVYGFGTSGFRIGMGYTQLPLENHSYLACNPARYRLIHSADQREQLSFGLGGALGRRFAIGLGLHWERLKQVRRFMINTTLRARRARRRDATSRTLRLTTSLT